MENKEQKIIKAITYAVPLTAIGILIVCSVVFGTQAVSDFLSSRFGMLVILLVAGLGVLMRFVTPKR